MIGALSLADGAPAARQRFEVLYARHQPTLRRIAWMLCGDPDLADDLVQETWLRAWRALDSLHDAAAARAWLVTILKREHARLFERKRLDLVALDEHHDAAAPAAAPADGIFLRQLLARLPRTERESLLMQVVDGRSTAEIAREHGVSRNAMTIRLHRARKKLQSLQ